MRIVDRDGPVRDSFHRPPLGGEPDEQGTDAGKIQRDRERRPRHRSRGRAGERFESRRRGESLERRGGRGSRHRRPIVSGDGRRSTDTDGDLPCRHHGGQQRQRQQRDHCERPAQMAQGRGGPVSGQALEERRRRQQQRGLDGDRNREREGGVVQEHAHRLSPSSRTRFRSADNRRYSASVIGSPLMSRSAAMAEPRELSKKVRTSCLQRGAAGVFGPGGRKVDVARAVVLAGEQAALDHDLEQLAHAGRPRRVRQLRADVLDGRAPAAVEDLHDLTLPAGQVDVCAFGHELVRCLPGEGEFFRPARIYSPSRRLSSNAP